MSQLQISLAAMFGLTAAAALAVVLFQQLGMFWILVIGGTIACFRGPVWEGVNPILLAVGYAAVASVFTCSLCYFMEVSPLQGIVPCVVLPTLAYIVSFLKGMENA